jgi:PAS domain S-box-containing protein
MLQQWFWIPPGALAVLALYQEVRIYQIHRESKRKEELFQMVTENAADMIALLDVKGRQLYNSSGVQKISGLLSRGVGRDLLPSSKSILTIASGVLDAVRKARETGSGRRLEYRIRHKDGSWRVLEPVASTIRDAKGEVVKLVIVNRDITERKRAEEPLQHNLSIGASAPTGMRVRARLPFLATLQAKAVQQFVRQQIIPVRKSGAGAS